MRTMKTAALAALMTMTAATAAPADVIDDISGLTLRLNASDLGLSNGDPVSAWGPLVAAGTNRPTYVASDAQFNGQAVVDFDGLSDTANGDRMTALGVNAQARTIFAVVNAETGGGLRGLLSNGGDGLNVRLNDASWYRSPGHAQDGNDFTGAGGTGGLSINTGAVPGQAINTYSANTPHVVSAVSAATQNYANLTVGNGSSGGAGPYVGRHWDGQIAEILMFDRRLSISEQNAVLGYVSSTYGIATTPARPGLVIGGLIGGDATDPENDGNPEADVNYNATFFGNDEAAFGGGEFAFNVFDNQVGGGNAKWCCNGIQAGGSFVGAQFDIAGTLDAFTVTSSNDSPERDPIDWAIQGSTDGSTWTDIFRWDQDINLFTARNQTLLFEAGIDYDVDHNNYTYFRYIAYQTGGSAHALGELEFFITNIPAPAALPAGLALMALGVARRRARRA